MKFQILSTLFIISCATTALSFHLEKPENGQLWAVLVAGSNTWDNYRHQADVCHSYQILHTHGIPDERIIVLMYDDLAQNSENPTPGIVINHPNGHDVYKGVPHDYTGDAVTPENFMAVLRGDKKALNGAGSGKVLKSGPNDHVFVYFADHGAPGLIAFPDSELTSSDLNKTINYMFKHKMYAKLVFYIEACESGSMFENILPDNINVYATTAANGEESSYACYFDEKRETYLGDSYSVNWMEDSDKEVLTNETLYQQFRIVKKETTESHVQEYGDMSIAKMTVSEFQGRKSSKPITLPRPENLDLVRSRDVPVEILKRKYLKSNSDDQKAEYLKKLNKMLRNRIYLSQKVTDILTEVFHNRNEEADTMDKHYKLTNFKCYDDVRKYFNEECFQLSKNAYALDFMYVLVNLCEKHVEEARVKHAMDLVCTHPPIHGIL
ncbi:legumain isoform X2 [Parasteatoda tepidariorum]|uniref:legumain isoform X2 n=1 Tax=Parasteatoda tepidariorum TaxID=114398 RepID=UPI001C725B60|nr:legumain isoform X2 [Parasteatoda tepidariorum]